MYVYVSQQLYDYHNRLISNKLKTQMLFNMKQPNEQKQ